MRETFYKNLQACFAEIRFCRSAAEGGARFQELTDEIRAARQTVQDNAPREEKAVLLYCIDTLFLLLEEGDPQTIFDYADAIHNVPEVYLGKRNLYSLRREMHAFRRKYGRDYFPFLRRLSPRFTRKAPENSLEFFSREADADFKWLFPGVYRLLCLLGIAAIVLPMVGYLVCAVLLELPSEWPLLLGMAGAFVFGVGLFNLVAAWMHQYLGHLLTAVCLLGGGALTAWSFVLLIP